MNKKIIKQFEMLVDQIKAEMDTEKDRKEKIAHSFRLRSIKKALKIIKDFKKQIKKGEDLKGIKGIGKGTMDRIDEIIKKGGLGEINLDEVERSYLKQIDELTQIIGIGRAKAYELVVKHNIQTIEDLINAHELNLVDLSHQIKMGLKYHNKYKENIPRKEILKIDNYLHKVLKDIDVELVGVICGSYRRKKATSGDIDILITHPKIKTKKDMINSKKNYLKIIVKKMKKDKFIVDDLTDKDYRRTYRGFSKYKSKPIRRIDIKFVPYKSYYSALLHFTGSGNFNVKMRQTAEDLGYKLNEYGLYKRIIDEDNEEEILKRVKINSEKDIFDKLGLEYVPPKDR